MTRFKRTARFVFRAVGLVGAVVLAVQAVRFFGASMDLWGVPEVSNSTLAFVHIAASLAALHLLPTLSSTEFRRAGRRIIPAGAVLADGRRPGCVFETQEDRTMDEKIVEAEAGVVIEQGWREDRSSTHWVTFSEGGPWQICHWIVPTDGEPPFWTSWLDPVEIGPALTPPPDQR